MKHLPYVMGLILLFCMTTAFAQNKFIMIQDKLRSAKIQAELASTEAQRELGLMNRKNLNANNGMLFIYNESSYLSFWMKNTLIPLDILFIDANKKIIDIQTMTPCVKDPCFIYISKYPAQYALEINAGSSKKLGIQVGDQLNFFTKY